MPARRYEPYKNADRRRRAEADAANRAAARYVVALAAVQEVPVPNNALKHFVVGVYQALILQTAFIILTIY
ncbi:hypothetical protein BT96DRAFT_1024116 [Gymnopus androsaceus JB14]|uniref:Uncharacterized protein n=1 Tax=Gymnopus androsaceus JB14 TaxID=1447944 RepID=A0A6A4GZK5_9AGAR|nr:hypothetical protein BT96DRAFT_1024116 [Gymnopus androsaceus JB14]